MVWGWFDPWAVCIKYELGGYSAVCELLIACCGCDGGWFIEIERLFWDDRAGDAANWLPSEFWDLVWTGSCW